MACKHCASENEQHFPGELTIVFPGVQGVEGIKLSTVYVSPEIVVCLECGYTELVIPEVELKQLRKGKKTYGSKSGK